MSEKIIEALKKLDTAADDNWTADGLPKLDKLGIEGLTRKEVTQAAPHFKRGTPVFDTPAQAKVQDEVKAAEAAKPTLAERHQAAKDRLAEATKVAAVAKKEYDKALVALDDIECEVAAVEGKRGDQQTIMDYLASQKIVRERRAVGG